MYSARGEEKQKFGVFREKPDGSGAETLVADRHHSYFFPLVSPDGREMVAATLPDVPVAEQDSQIVLLDLPSGHTSFLAYGLHPTVVWGK